MWKEELYDKDKIQLQSDCWISVGVESSTKGTSLKFYATFTNLLLSTSLSSSYSISSDYYLIFRLDINIYYFWYEYNQDGCSYKFYKGLTAFFEK